MSYYKVAVSAKRASEELYLLSVEAGSAEEAEAKAKLIVYEYPGPAQVDGLSQCKRVKQETVYTDIKDVEVHNVSG